jgi:hypothetical protein
MIFTDAICTADEESADWQKGRSCAVMLPAKYFANVSV